MKLDDLDALRLDIGLVRNTHQTLESIVERMRTPIHEPVIKEPVELWFMPLGYPLD